MATLRVSSGTRQPKIRAVRMRNETVRSEGKDQAADWPGERVEAQDMQQQLEEQEV